MIMYHYVRPVKNSKYPNLKALEFKKFKDQINFFKKNFEIIDYEEFVEIIKFKKISKNKKIILTFDDGYKDNYDYVFPELIKNKICGFFYPPTKVIENKDVLDVNKIHFLLEKEQNRKKILKDINLELKKNNYKIISELKISSNTLRSRYDDLETSLIKKLLQHILPFKIRDKILNVLTQRYLDMNMKEFAKELYMDESQLVELYNNKMHIGSHGEYHYRWGKLNEKQQEAEIINPIKFFKNLKFDTKNLSVCYPYGSYNKTTHKLVKKSKFKFGITTEVGIIDEANLKNKFALKRLNANDFLDV